MDHIYHLTTGELGRSLRAGDLSSEEATRAVLQRAKATASFGAYLHLDEEGAVSQAQTADARRRRGDLRGPLDGIPLALKDNLLCEGLPATCGSRILQKFVAPYDATVVRRLKDAGAVILGKLNMDEFAMGSTNEYSAFGVARNPWDPACVPGGSSGGAAVAVASGSACAALGTDTGGSIRQPASFCGIVGMKPTYGRVSRFGVVAFASSLDQVGPMTKSVTDCAALLQAIAGTDPRDATCAERDSEDFATALEAGVAGMKLGIPKEYFVDGLDPEVRAAVDAALGLYQKLGAELVPISLPHTDHGIATYYLIATAEASSNLARFDGVRYGMRRDPGKGLADMYQATRGAGFGLEVKRRILLGTYALSAGHYDDYYGKAQKARTLVRADFEQAFARVDAIITPTSPQVACAIGQNTRDPLAMYLADAFTVGCNLAGLPALSLPCGSSAAGLPIGLQVLTPWWREALTLRVARAYERETPWHTQRAQP